MFEGHPVAVVIPAFREERLIRKTLLSVPDFVDTIVVVDDASDDATLEAAQSSGDPRLSCVRHSVNRGVGASIVTGYEKAIELGASLIAVMAGDAQMDGADLPGLLAPLAAGRADYVKGNRFKHENARAMPWHRRLAGRGLALLTRAATGLAINDSQCGYTAITAQAARALPLRELWPRYGYPNDLLGLLAERAMRVVEVPVRPIYGDEQSGVRPWHAISVACVILRRWRKGIAPLAPPELSCRPSNSSNG